MPVHTYIAQNQEGKEIKGKMHADSEQSLMQALEQRGLFMISSAVNTAPDTEKQEADAKNKKYEKIDLGQKQLLIASRQLEISLNSGVPMIESLGYIADQSPDPNTKAVFGNLVNSLMSGLSFSTALKNSSNSFSTMYLNTIRAGEKSGMMSESMTKMADYMEKQDEFRKKIRTYLIYPAIVVAISMTTLVFMTMFLLPSFIEQLGIPREKLPLLTRVLLDGAMIVKNYWYLFAAAVAGLAWYSRKLFRTSGNNLALDGFMLKVPLLGGLMLKICVSRFMATLATLLENGVSILESLEVSKEVTGNSVLAREIDLIHQHVCRGRGMAEKMQDSAYFPPLVGSMVATGEISGKLPRTLLKVSEYYDKEVDSALRDFFASLEPLLILFLGIVVGVIATGMLLPLLNLSEYVG